MFNDRYGLPISTNSQAAADHFGEAADAVLSFNLGAEAALRSAIEEDEGFAVAHAVLGLQLQ